MPTVTITGPTTLAAGASGTYRLTIAGGPGVKGGLDVLAYGTGGTLSPADSSTKVKDGEITHTAPKAFSNNSVSFDFILQAPSTPGNVALTGTGLSCDGNGSSSGDNGATYGMNVTIVSDPSAPSAAQPAAANPATVTGTTTQLSVLGADLGGEPSLTYAWSWSSTAGAVSVGLSKANGTNGAKSVLATFSAAGTYTFQALITNKTGHTATSSVTVVVKATPTSLVVTPASVTISKSTAEQFQAAVLDQFGGLVAGGSGLTWSVTGGGTISGSGAFTADATAGGPFAVTVSQSSLSANASLTVSDSLLPAPSISQPASAPSGPVTTGTAHVSVQGSDATGEAALTYSWFPLNGPGTVAFSPNGSHAAASSVATFSEVGDYVLQATVTDPQGRTAVSTVPVSVTSLTAGGPGAGTTVALFGLASTRTMSGIQTLRATALDPTGIAKVTFLLDSVELGTVSVPAYELRVDTRQFANGPHVLTVRATTTDGRVSTSAPATITISNLGDIVARLGCSSAPASSVGAALLLVFWSLQQRKRQIPVKVRRTR